MEKKIQVEESSVATTIIKNIQIVVYLLCQELLQNNLAKNDKLALGCDYGISEMVDKFLSIMSQNVLAKKYKNIIIILFEHRNVLLFYVVLIDNQISYIYQILYGHAFSSDVVWLQQLLQGSVWGHVRTEEDTIVWSIYFANHIFLDVLFFMYK